MAISNSTNDNRLVMTPFDLSTLQLIDCEKSNNHGDPTFHPPATRTLLLYNYIQRNLAQGRGMAGFIHTTIYRVI